MHYNKPMWHLIQYKSLSLTQLYNILQLRNAVFVVEQQCAYQDLDGIDQQSLHLFTHNTNDNILAYCRIIPPGIVYPQASIGRVITANEVRRAGYGKQLMLQAIQHCHSLYPNHDIKIGAQLYLKHFYQHFGFEASSQVYLEDGIAHIHMVLKA